jgi:prepilin-type N-terminal cleavage/methylation domain-containing protein
MCQKLGTPVGHDFRDMNAPKIALKNDRGFSLLELCVVVAILMIVAAVVFINAVSAIRNIRLTQSATSYANLLQQARIRAVQDDTYYTVRTVVSGTNPPTAFVDLAQTGTYSATAPTDPLMTFLVDVTPMAFSTGPGLADLESKFLPAGSIAIATVATTGPGPTFGPRGLPCTPSAPSGGTCPSMTPTSYITFLQNTQSTKWEAVTVTPAGRIGVWSYDGTSWSPLN